ncbi:hypothetical protein [Actinophytocola sp. NPDC049390]|uniref:hypothetical protein n=1 Tax=Actinophytocola sp. NPDC049390 TaxID=3363894 RepID=UPI0037A65BF9
MRHEHREHITAAAAMIGYLRSVVAANIASVHWPPLVLGGLVVPAGSVFAGTSLTARDVVHDRLGARGVAVGIAAGAGLSAVFASPQIAVASKADVKYWIVAQKHPDLRDHFQQLALHARRTAAEFRDNHDPFSQLQRDHLALKKHCTGLEELVRTYAQVINELTLENKALREQASSSPATVTPLRRHVSDTGDLRC